MPDRIRLLPEIVASQIAAGQVVQGPFSVVKEMMENALDAGARTVTVNIREGGHDLIQVVDDGCGMSPVDARMAFDHHATSKIKTVDDIYALHTFGFRGEALASIAAVAQVELRTRQADDQTGTVTTIHGGRFVAQEPMMCAAGTQMLVRNIFYNIPARRKSLPTPVESRNRVRTEFNRVALCYPDKRFELYENDAPVMILEPASLANRIVDVVGRGIKQNLLEVSVDTSIVRIEGFIGRPDAAMKGTYSRKDAMRYLFVNGRFFKSPYFYSAILKAYDKLIPEGYTPSYFLYLTVDPTRIDVNMDTSKVDVKFADEAAVWSIMNAAVRETLAKTGAVSMMSFSEDDASVEIPVARRGAIYGEPRANYDDSYNPFREGYTDGATDRPATTKGRKGGKGDNGASLGGDFGGDFGGFGGFGGGNFGGSTGAGRGVGPGRGSGRGSGGAVSHRFDAAAGLDIIPSAGFDEIPSQAFGSDDASSLEFIEPQEYVQTRISDCATTASTATTATTAAAENTRFDAVMPAGGGYAVAMLGGRCVAVDLRRAMERVLYDDYAAMLRSGSVPSQQLLFPERLTLSNEDYALLEEHAVEFATVGFDIEYSGGTTVDVKGTPADMPAERTDELLYELLRAMDTPQTAMEIRRQRIAAVMARNGARTINPNMDHRQAEALLERLAATGNVSYTHTGKKISAPLTADELKNIIDRQ